MEALLDHGEGLLVPERMIVAPGVGTFRPVELGAGSHITRGQTVGVLEGPGTETPVESPFAGRIVGMLAHPGERIREGQPIAWLRVRLMRACITGWGAAVPAGRLTNADLEARVETSDQWIVDRTGIRERRVAAEGETTATLAIEAGANAIKSAGITPDAIDLLVIATTTPEQPIPHTGAFVSDGLGLRCGSFDINVGCAGFIYELVTGAALLQAGNLDHVLVIGCETLSRIVDPRDRGTCIIFGDGAAGVVLAPTTDDGPGILGWDLGCDGSATGLVGLPAGGSRLPASQDTIDEGLHYLKMQGQEVFRRAVRTVVESVNVTLARSGITADDVDWFIPHQANLRIIEAASSRLGIPAERTVVNIERYGNTSAASIPLALSEAADDGRIRDGDLILMSGFGAGMAWGSAVVRWGRA